MSEPAEPAEPPKPRRGRPKGSPNRPTAKRWSTSRREGRSMARRVSRLINAGVSVTEIAERERLTLERLRDLIEDILAGRAPWPPE